MNITHEEFEVLQLLVRRERALTQAHVADALPMLNTSEIEVAIESLLNKDLAQCTQGGIKAQPEAIVALEPYRVKRAVILAAGLGQRMRPETATLPKPMVLVHEKRIIETQLDALIAAGITDITIVRGYHGESFDSLLVNYPKLKFIDNPHWNTTGAIVSAALAIDLLEGAYLIEGDLFINNPNVIRSYEYRSSYCGIPSNVSNDWYFCTDSSEHIQQLGFGTIHKFVGIMFWTSKDVRRLKKDLKSIMQDSKHHQRFIESVPFDSQTGNYDIFARSLRMEEVVEVDTYEELQSLRIRFK